jgi:hypothetical protein
LANAVRLKKKIQKQPNKWITKRWAQQLIRSGDSLNGFQLGVVAVWMGVS